METTTKKVAPKPISTRVFDMVDVQKIKDSPYQNRKRLGDIDALAQSITVHGILNPLTMRKVGVGEYEMIAGHRRLEAAKAIKLEAVPAIVIDCEDRE